MRVEQNARLLRGALREHLGDRVIALEDVIRQRELPLHRPDQGRPDRAPRGHDPRDRAC